MDFSSEKSGRPVFLPVQHEFKATLDAVPPPLSDLESRYFFWAHVNGCLRAVFLASRVKDAHAHRFRHTLAKELVGRGATYEEVARCARNSPETERRHHGKWSAGR